MSDALVLVVAALTFVAIAYAIVSIPDRKPCPAQSEGAAPRAWVVDCAKTRELDRCRFDAYELFGCIP